MKKYIILIFLVSISNVNNIMAQDNYKIDWDKVNDFDNKGLPKSALEIVSSIHAKAAKANNTNQVIKALIHKAKYMLSLEEDAQLNIIKELKTEIKTNQFPTKNILENVLANLYWQYFNQNRWKFYNRTHTSEKVDTEDFRTWDLETLFTEVHTHYQKSMSNGVLSQQTALEKFETILSNEYNSKKYRPTLYDFLAHNALEFYKTTETNITRPAYAFKIDSPDYLKGYKTFSELKISTQDSLSLQFQALKLYQNLIKFHARDTEPDALIDVNIERLLFIKEHATVSEKLSLLRQTFISEKELHKTHQVSAVYDYNIAKLYQEEGLSYVPKTNEIYRWELKKALEICETTLKKFPDSRGANNCKALQKEILNKEVAIQTEKVISIQKPGRLLITYKNLDTLHLSALKINHKKFLALQRLYQEDEIIAFLNKLTQVKNWETPVCNEHDYQKHTTEVLIPELEQGAYLIVASVDKVLSTESIFAFGDFQVSDLVLIENKTPEKVSFQVMDRNNGKPIANAKILLKTERENRYDKKINKTLITDKNGQAHISVNTYYYDVSLTVSYEKDVLKLYNYHLSENYIPNHNERLLDHTTFMFTDRSIYRPGQTVYFKGIMMSQKGKETPKVVPNSATYASLKDVNGQLIKTLQFKTNKYGSFHGEFILPSSGLTGRYTIETYNYQSISFSVEEYKRPKFETKINPVTETYKVNDTIKLSGVATAYAGSTITDAKVVYRVHRKVRYPIWCYWYSPNYGAESQEITQGEAKTNDKGEYFINFKALPDPSSPKENLPVFIYEITADVTDINGETRTSTTDIKVGYHALNAIIDISNTIDKTKKEHSFTISTKNLNDEYVTAEGNIKIFKLKAPKKPLRKRPWNAPDYEGFKEEEFKKLFPHDAYENEDDYRSWNKGTVVYDETFNTKETKDQTKGVKKLSLGNIKKWESGTYAIELQSKDRFGQEVKDIKYFTAYDQNENKISDHQLFSITTNKTAYTINDEVLIKIESASDDITVTIDIEKNHKIISTELIKLSNNSKTIRIPVTKEDLGGFAVHYSFVNYNSYQSGTLPIAIPYEAIDLSIETKVFRDKLQPGQPEIWSFMIKGAKGDKVSAELLASMYDASLDQFVPHQWGFNPDRRPVYYSYNAKKALQSFGVNGFRVYNLHSNFGYSHQYYDQLNWFGLYFRQQYYGASRQMMKSRSSLNAPLMNKEAAFDDSSALEEESEAAIGGSAKGITEDQNDTTTLEDTKKEPSLDGVPIRKNLQETAFFFPQLATDADGNISFNFTTPEALTRWKLQLLAHTKDGQTAIQTLETVTQKELMILPNPPRFLREGDKIVLSTKISNLATKDLNGVVELQLIDAITNKAIDAQLENTNARQTFDVKAAGNTNISWELKIPDNIQTVQYKIIAKAGEFSDGEQNVLPVLSNRMLVTETLPMWIRSDQTKTFTLDKLKNNTSKSLKHHKLTLEMTSNPAWYAVQALPYLMEYPYECSEQTFSRFYANSLASHIANSNPRIQEVFNQWKSTDALLSNLEKNQELKSLIIQETPWLRDAQSETEQKKRIALLFDLNKMNSELASALRKLQQTQHGSGGFPWFQGGRENRFITQYIASGFGHLKKLGVTKFDTNTTNMIQKALRYLDQEFVKEYEELKRYCKKNKIDINKDHLSYTQVHYMYMRSFFADISLPKNTKEANAYYLGQAKKYWLKKSLYTQGLLALVLHRNEDSNTATKIIRSLDENSITSEELGMYWKSNTASWFWYQAPIETQALMIETFSEIEKEPKRTEVIDNLKVWLLKNKQTNRWSTTKSTSEAIYALLLQGSDWLSVTDMVDITLGDLKIDPSQMKDIKVEAGTGYFKTSWNGNEVQSKMASATITKKGKGIAWGALYWQYFEDLDKITSAETPLSLKKKLFLKKNSDRGEEITEITDKTKLQLGDLVRVRIELRSDRAMEFVHMKDMRASGLEPINVISRYKWQDNLGYYESTKDASTNFFFDYLPKGVYVFEYDLRVNNKGEFSNGITTIQSMYAPEFSSHSEGVRISVK